MPTTKADEQIGMEVVERQEGEEERLVAYLCLEEVWPVTVSPMADIQQPVGGKDKESRELRVFFYAVTTWEIEL